MHPEISRKEEKLRHLFDQAKALQQIDDVDNELKAQFLWYLCIRTSGYGEYSVRTTLLEFYESSTNHQPLSDFVIKQLRLSREFSVRRARALIKSFKEKQDNSSGEFDYGKLETTLESIQTSRNSIAHGGDAYQLSMSDLDGYFADAKEVIRMVYEECNPAEA